MRLVRFFLVVFGLLVTILTSFPLASAAPTVVDTLQLTGNNVNFAGVLGSAINFNVNNGRIFDDGQLHISSPDIYLDANGRVYAENDLTVGRFLMIMNQTTGHDTGVYFQNDGQLRLNTPDSLYLNAPNTLFIQNDAQIGDDLTVTDILTVNGNTLHSHWNPNTS